eukprot:NODE_367_length_8687_cov_0.577084.p2 type:complete len:288 gc:universal NODE_367_length_8687_cov_0.577084:3114-2251(-)
MSQNPFHSQDSLFRFDLNGDLVVNYSQETESRQECDTVNPFNLQSWLQKCASIRCCTARCISHVSGQDLEVFKNKFQAMGKHEQELLLKGILVSCQKQQHSRRKVFEYHVFPLGKLCRKAFCHLVSMSNQKLQNIINSMELKWTKRVHGNKDMVFLHAFTFEQKECILNWIKTFAIENGEPRPGRMYTRTNHTRRVRDTSILWLPADFTIAKLHGIYIRDASTLNINVETFRKYFKLCGNIKIKSCKTDVCDTCTVFREQLNVQDLSESATFLNYTTNQATCISCHY